jgi:hypothetical protein
VQAEIIDSKGPKRPAETATCRLCDIRLGPSEAFDLADAHELDDD